MDRTKRMGASTIMKYFTRQWFSGDLSDKQTEEILQKYNSYVSRVYSKLPVGLKLLIKHINLHDGIIRKLTLSTSSRDLTLSGIFGDLEVGYFKLQIEYKELININVENILNVFSNAKIEIIGDEIEVFEKEKHSFFVHSFIFSNKSEFKIEFCECNLKIESASAKDYIKKTCLLVGFDRNGV